MVLLCHQAAAAAPSSMTNKAQLGSTLAYPVIFSFFQPHARRACPTEGYNFTFCFKYWFCSLAVSCGRLRNGQGWGFLSLVVLGLELVTDTQCKMCRVH